jgi:hypothetical protein
MGTAIFPTGTTTIFRQSNAPVGWTKDNTYNDYTLRVVNGATSTGGSVNFSSIMTTQTISGTVSKSGSPGPTVNTDSGITNPPLPSHNHPAAVRFFNTTVPANVSGPGTFLGWNTSTSATAGGSAGGDSGHSHTISATSTFAGSSKNFSINYVDVIIASIN